MTFFTYEGIDCFTYINIYGDQIGIMNVDSKKIKIKISKQVFCDHNASDCEPNCSSRNFDIIEQQMKEYIDDYLQLGRNKK